MKITPEIQIRQKTSIFWFENKIMEPWCWGKTFKNFGSRLTSNIGSLTSVCKWRSDGYSSPHAECTACSIFTITTGGARAIDLWYGAADRRSATKLQAHVQWRAPLWETYAVAASSVCHSRIKNWQTTTIRTQTSALGGHRIGWTLVGRGSFCAAHITEIIKLSAVPPKFTVTNAGYFKNRANLPGISL